MFRSHGSSPTPRPTPAPWHRRGRPMRPSKMLGRLSLRDTPLRWRACRGEMGFPYGRRSRWRDFAPASQSNRRGVAMSTIGFVELPSVTSEAQALFDEDIAEDGYVWNVTKLWSHNAPLVTGLFDLMGQAVADQNLTFRQRGILVAACASTLGDAYCAVAWGSKLAGVSDPDFAAAVIRCDDEG